MRIAAPGERGATLRRAVAAAGLLLALAVEPAIAARSAAASPSLHGTLFRIERAGRPASYVLGTLHSGDPRVLATVERLDPVLAQIRTVAVEAERGPGDQAAFLEAAQWQDGRRLADCFAPDAVARIHALLDAELPAAVVEHLKPWAVFLKLAEDPRAATPTLDDALVERARRDRRVVVGLELPEEQAAAFDAIPLASQVALALYVLDHRAELASSREAAHEAWLAGDLAKLGALTLAPAERDPSLYPHLAALAYAVVEGRSALLAHRLFGPLRAGRVLVLVGASHLAGEHGLLALLAEQGYRIRPVSSRRSAAAAAGHPAPGVKSTGLSRPRAPARPLPPP